MDDQRQDNHRFGIWRQLQRALQLVQPFTILALVGTCFWLAREARNGFRDAANARLDPLQLGAFASAPRPDGNVVVLYGDSRAAQWPAPELPGYTVINHGLGGQTTAQVLMRYDAHVAPLKPDVLVIQVGINDLRQIGVLSARRDQIIADCTTNISALAQRATTDGTRVIITTIFPTGAVPPAGWLVWSSTIPLAVAEVNTSIRALAGPQVQILDAYTLLADGDTVAAPYANDTLHIAQAGYAPLNVALGELLKQ